MDEQSRAYQNYLAETSQKRSIGAGQEFTEFQWNNGNLGMHRKGGGGVNEVKEDPKPHSSAMEDEIASLFQYPPYEYLEKEFGCDFLCDFPNPQSIIAAEKSNKSMSFNPSQSQNRLSPPKSNVHDSVRQYVCPENSSSIVDFPGFSKPTFKKKIHSLRGESSSMMTTEPSICGSSNNNNNNTTTTTTTTSLLRRKFKKNLETSFLSERLGTETFEVTGTSSSGVSGVSIKAKPEDMNNQNLKRKGIEMEESCSFSEEGDYESADGKKPAQRSRRIRAAEVHNLSERKRRDRINEKMKALQELIPHCTKSDKASMLDEAIEYLKSLQQQVQLLWMGSGMATMMFPSIQNFMAQMSMGIGRGTMPNLDNMVQLPRVPILNQQLPSLFSPNQNPMCPQSFSHFRFPNQMQSSQMPDSFPPHLGFSQQAMNLYAYGSQLLQQNQMAEINRSSDLPTDGLPPNNGK